MNDEERTAVIEWEGEEYELKYTFSIVRRLRAAGVNVLRIFRAIQDDVNCTVEYGDDICYVVAWLLREAGAQGVTDELVWRWALADKRNMVTVVSLFNWICAQHFASSKVDKPKKTSARKKSAKKK